MVARPSSFRLRAVWLIAFALLAAIAGALAFLGSWAEDRVRASLEARSSVERLHRAIIEAERAQRAYILTQDAYHLADATAARAKLDALAETLRAVVERNAIDSAAVDDLFALVDQRDAQLGEAINELQLGDLGAAVEVVRRNELRRTSAAIFDIVAAIDEEENRILAERDGEVRLFRALLLVSIFGVAGAAFLVTGASLGAERRLAERLALSNRELERRVEERTSELAIERNRIEHLLRDLSHRVGNNLSMVSSFLLLEAMKAEDPRVREALEAAHRRILGIASAQRRLRIEAGSAHVDAATYLAYVIDDVRDSLPVGEVALNIEAEAVPLRGADAVALGIIVNELVTNALKHAFPDGRGRVTVALRAQDGSLILDVADDGRGYCGEEGGGLGALLVRSMVAALGGRVLRTVAGSGPRPGTRWSVRFAHRPPAAAPASAAALA